MALDALLADLAIVFLAGVVAVLGLGRVGLPPVVGFLVAGVLIGPEALGLVDDPHTIEVMAELGVALLLFTIGLEFSFDRLRRIGRLVALGGSLQVGLTVGAFALGAVALGASAAGGVFWGYLAALSSTAIVLRALADRGEVDAPHGRFVVGVLIFQDLCIVPMMLTVPLLASGEGSLAALALVLGKAAAVVALVVLAARQLVPALLRRAAGARSRELFVLSVLFIASGVAWATASMGLSIALGAFLAGIVVAETEYVHQVLTEVTPFRDALASLFFVSVGMLLDPMVLVEHPAAVAGLVLLLVLGKLAIASLAVLFMRFPARVAILAGLALAQVGEFSFVLLRSGEAAGLIDPAAAALFLAASVVTMMAAPILLGASPRLAAGARLLRPLERLLAVRDADETEADADGRPLKDHVVVAGLGLGGRALLHSLAGAGIPYVGLDLDPDVIVTERAAGRNVRYGDATSAEVLEHVAHVAHARQVVLLLSDAEAGRRAASLLVTRFPELPVLLRVHRQRRDGAAPMPGVQIVAEDAETSVEIVERVLRRIGVDGALMASLVAAARAERDAAGDPTVAPAAVAAALTTQGVTLADGDAAVGQTIAELGLREAHGALVAALSRDGRVMPTPSPRKPLRAGDTLFLVGEPARVAAAVQHLATGVVAPVPARPAPPAAPPPAPPTAAAPAPWPRSAALGYAVALAAPLGVTGAVAFLNVAFDRQALFLYAVAVLAAGAAGGRRAATLAGLLSFVLANITFVHPVGELTLEPRILPLAALCLGPVLVVMLMRRLGLGARVLA